MTYQRRPAAFQRKPAADPKALEASRRFQAPGADPKPKPTVKAPQPKSRAEETLALHIRAEGLPVPVREFCFHPDRKFRLDFAWPQVRIGVEVQGLGLGGRMGGHQTAAGMRRDCEKANLATAVGWRVLVFTSAQVRDLSAIKVLQQLLQG
jgi:very-short-patch-repair endonuclease